MSREIAPMRKNLSRASLLTRRTATVGKIPYTPAQWVYQQWLPSRARPALRRPSPPGGKEVIFQEWLDLPLGVASLATDAAHGRADARTSALHRRFAREVAPVTWRRNKRYRAGFRTSGVHLSNDRPRSVEELDAELHRQRPRRRSISAATPGSALSDGDGGGGSRVISIWVAVSRPTAWPTRSAAIRAPGASARACGPAASCQRAGSRHARVGELLRDLRPLRSASLATYSIAAIVF